MTDPGPSAHGAELARLDVVIAENDAKNTPEARMAAADAVYQKASILEEGVGPDTALPLYEEVARRLRGVTEPQPREMLICTLNDIAMIHYQHDRSAESRRVAEEIFEEHFHDPPHEAMDVVADAALHLARLLKEVDEDDRALELMEQVVERYGRPGIPNHFLIRSAGNASIAGHLAFMGRVEEGIALYDTVIEELWPSREEQAQVILANALSTQAHYLYELNRVADADARCEQLLARFTESTDDEVEREVVEARAMLLRSRRRQGRTFRLRRR